MNRKLDSIILVIIAIALIILVLLTYKTCQMIKVQDEAQQSALLDADEEVPEVYQAEEDAEDHEVVPDESFTPAEVEVDPSPAGNGTGGTTPPILESDLSPYNFLVIAGSFSQQSNADGFSKQLKDLGFESEVVRFDDSPYFTVAAGKAEDLSTAERLLQQLKSKKMDGYIHRKK